MKERTEVRGKIKKGYEFKCFFCASSTEGETP